MKKNGSVNIKAERKNIARYIRKTGEGKEKLDERNRTQKNKGTKKK